MPPDIRAVSKLLISNEEKIRHIKTIKGQQKVKVLGN